MRLLTFGATLPLALVMLYVCLYNVWLRLDYVCRAFLANILFGLYVCIRLVQQCRESSEHAEITKSLSSLGCLRGGGGRGLHYGHLVLNGALHYVWLRFYYVWEHPSNSLKKRPCQVWYRSVAGSLKPFGMRLGYVSCNSIANEQFESTNLYVCIRLVQPFHRFVSGPLRLVTFVYV